jgi:hypothetical protein
MTQDHANGAQTTETAPRPTEATNGSRSSKGKLTQMKPALQALAPHEMAYWKRVWAGMQEAQQHLQQAQAMEQQAAQHRERAVSLQGAYVGFADHLFELHGLDKEQDLIDPQGQIKRGALKAAAS